MSINHEKIKLLTDSLSVEKNPEVKKIIQTEIARLEATDYDENSQDKPKDLTGSDKSDALSKDFKDYNGAKVFQSDKSKISADMKKLLDREAEKKNKNFFNVSEKKDKKEIFVPAVIVKDKEREKFGKPPTPNIPPDLSGSEEIVVLNNKPIFGSAIIDDKKGNFWYYSVKKGVFLRLPNNLGDLELAPRFMLTDVLVSKDDSLDSKDKEDEKDKDKGKDKKENFDYAGFCSDRMLVKTINGKFNLTEDIFSIEVAKLRQAMRTIGADSDAIYLDDKLVYTYNRNPVVLSPGLSLIIGEATSGKTSLIKSFGASINTIGEPTADSLPFDRRTFTKTVIDSINKNKISALDSIRLLLLEGDNLVSGGVSIASAGMLTALSSALARYKKQYFIAINPSSAKASAAVGDAFLGSVTSVFQLNKYDESRYTPEAPWLGVTGSVSTRKFNRNYFGFTF